MTRLARPLAAAALLLAAAPAPAAFVVSYSFTGSPGDQRGEAPDGPVPNVVASDLTRGPGLTGVAVSNSLAARGFPSGTTFDPAAGYFTLTVAPAADFTLDLDLLQFFQLRTTPGPQTVQVRTSLDGFASIVGGTQTTTSGTTPGLRTVAFGSAFDAVAGPLEIRIYGTGATAAQGVFRLTDGGSTPGLRLSGVDTPVTAAAVPEPASLALVGAGTLGLIGYARRRKAVA